MTFSNPKTVKFVKRHLSLLPGEQEGSDVNKMAIIFYSIISLSALNIDVESKYSKYSDWIQSHYTTIKRSTDGTVIGGFTGSLNFHIPEVTCISLPNTLFALLTLLAIGDDSILKDVTLKEQIGRFISTCQIPSHGGFVSNLDYHNSKPSPVDSSDLRFAYIAVAVLYILGCRTIDEYNEFIDVNKLLFFIKGKQCSTGAYGDGTEPHAGYTSCALSTLSLLNQVGTLTEQFKNDTIEWLVLRQVSNKGCMKLQDGLNESYELIDHGGFQGRENKFADTCYGFWCLNSLKIVSPESWNKFIQIEPFETYLTETTGNDLVGGFQKNNESNPDLYHTCLGIASLELVQGRFDGPLCIPQHVASKYNL